MTRAILIAALVSCQHGSLYRGRHVHVGVRPAAELNGAAVTVQITTDSLP